MGGGRLHMVPNTEVIPGSSRKGKRRDGQNLMKMWEKEMSKQNGRLKIRITVNYIIKTASLFITPVT